MKTVQNQHIGLVGSVFANGSGDQVSIPGRVILKGIKGKVEQSRESNSVLSYNSV